MRSPEAPPAETPVSTLVAGRYRLDEEIGRGASSRVYRAHDLLEGETCAVKVLVRPDDAVIAEARAEFAVLTRIRHPGVVAVRDMGCCPEHGWFIAMDFVGATTLRQAVEGATAETRAGVSAQVAGQILEALHHVHGLGLVHADVKPTNVLASGGSYRLVDFGLAGRHRGARGTLVYMAPEVLDGHDPEERSDLYSLGLTVLEVLRGAPLFSRADERLGPHRPAALSLAALDLAAAPEPLQRLLRGVLPEEMGCRLRSAEEALESLLGGERPRATRTAARRWDLPFAGKGEGVSRLLAGVRLRLQGAAEPSLHVVAGSEGMGKSRLLQELSRSLRLEGTEVARASARRPDIAGQWRLALGIGGRARPWECEAALILDDVEALPPGDLDATALALSGCLVGKAAIVLAGRPGTRLETVVSRLAAGAPVVEEALAPLGGDEVREAVSRVLGFADGSADAGDLVMEASGGVPGRVIEVLAAMEASRVLSREGGRWLVAIPRARRRALLAKLERPRRRRGSGSAAARRDADPILVAVALVAPRPVLLDELEPVLGAQGSATFLQRIRALEAAGHLAPAKGATGDRAVELADLVTRSRILAPSRRAVAATLAAGLLDALADRLDAVCRDELLARAGRDGERDALADEVADRLESRGLLEEAAGRLLQGSPHAGRVRRAAAMLSRAGQGARAKRLLEKLARREKASGGPDPETLLELADALEATGRPDEALATLESCRGALPGGLRLRGLLARLWILLSQGRLEEAQAVADEARGLPAEDPRLAASRLARLANLAHRQGRPEEALARYREAADAFRSAGHLRGLAACANGTGACLRGMGRVDEAIAHLEEAVTLLEEVGDVGALARGEANLGNALYEAGEWRAAEARWRRSTILLRPTQDRLAIARNLVNLGDLMKDQGRYEAAEGLMDQAAKLAARAPLIRAHALLNAAEIGHRRGRLKEAAATLARVRGLVRESPELTPVLALRMAELALAGGKARRARRLADAASRFRAAAASPAIAAQAARLRAVLSRVEGKPHVAIRILGEAESTLGSGHPLLRARLEAERALSLRDLSSLDAAREAQGRALAAFQRLGAEPDRDRLLAGFEAVPAGAAEPSAPSEVLLEVTRAVSSELSLDRLLALIVDKAIQITCAERGYLVLLSRTEQPFRSRVGRAADGKAIADHELDVSLSTIREVVATGRTVAMAEAREGGHGTDSVLRLGLRFLACAPIRTRTSAILGAIYVDSAHAGQGLGPTTVALLEALAAQAGVAIVNAELYEEQRRKNELISIVSHELRSPLTSIKCYVDLLRMESAQVDETRRRRFLDLMDAECVRLCRLVENILDVARLESGKESWTVARLDLAEILRHVQETCSPQATRKNLDLAVVLPGDLPHVLGNRDRVLQVVVNLAGNAIKFTPPGGHVGLSAVRRNGGGHRAFVEVRVSDDGPGIDPSEVELIFEKFGRVGRRERYQTEGTGLGLPIAREIVEAHGGRLWVESKPGQGSTFAFRLPAADPA